ncbi:hypothetical protein EON83_12505 [bacterium]|nr:MAG: hypothetical protein EON83_12505 [bacterium]
MRFPIEMKHQNISALVVWFLGIIGIILALGVIWLTANGAKIDGGVFTMAGGAIGALGAILTQTRQTNQREGDKPEPLEVVTPPNQPLETTDVSDEQTDNSPTPQPSPLAKVVQRP